MNTITKVLTILVGVAAIPSAGAAEVLNKGIPGNSTNDLLKRLESDVFSHHPDLVIILIGTNDRINSRKLVPLDDYLTNIATLIQRIRANGSNVILVSPPPCIPDLLLTRHKASAYGDETSAMRLQSTAQSLKKFCEGETIPFVDFHAHLVENNLVHLGKESVIRNPANSGSTDGVHPTTQGYQLLANLVHGAMINEKLAGDKVICLGDSITYGSGMQGAGTVQGQTYPAKLRELLHASDTESN